MSKQQKFHMPKTMLAYGGDLRKKAKNRGARSLVYRSGSMHFTLRSTRAKGSQSFLAPKNRERIKNFLYSFSAKKGVKILSFANVGNHLHLHVKIHNQTLYKAWIRGLSSGIAMICVGLEGFKRLAQQNTGRARGEKGQKENNKFWDQRPFSRVIQSFKHFLNTKSYVEINILEGLGMPRIEAEILIHGSRKYFRSG